MPATTQADVRQGLTPPPPGEEVNPETKIKKIKNLRMHIQRRRYPLGEEQLQLVKTTLQHSWDEWITNTSSLRSKLRDANDLMEGIKRPKNFPWPESSNLHIPLIEIHITICHSVTSSTMLDMDPVWYVKALVEGLGPNVDPDIEKFLHWKAKTEWKIDVTLSDIYWCTYRDGTGIGDLDWIEEYEKQFDIERYDDVRAFKSDFPDHIAAGISAEEYKSYIQTLLEEEAIQLLVEERVEKYRGPKLRIVELKDFIVVPTTSPHLEYAMVIADAFIQRADYFIKYTHAAKDEEEWFDKGAVERMTSTAGLTQSPDQISQAQDQIEGISRTRVTKADEYWCMQGILKIDLNGKGEEKFLFVYHRDTGELLRFERYPYIHNRIKYIIWRFKKRPNRLLGQSIYEQLLDINEEVDTQHNQRVDSRTITTVPSFLRVEGVDFDPTRKNQFFYPGVTFKVTNFNQIKQFDIKQTDMGQSMQEEQNLFLIADTRTGASQLRSGREVSRDPRAPAKKVQSLIQQSNQRLDDHMRELRIGTAELGAQLLELCYQFCPDLIPFPKFNKDTQAFVQSQMDRKKLRNRNMVLEVARTSTSDNPAQLIQMALTKYQLLVKDPFVGGLVAPHRELLERLLNSWRERDIDKLLLPLDQLEQALQAQTQSKAGQKAEAAADGNKTQNKDNKGHRAMDTSNATAAVQS